MAFEYSGWDPVREQWVSEAAKRAYDESLKHACDRASDVVHTPLEIDGLHLELEGEDVPVLICVRCGVLHVAPAVAARLMRVTEKQIG